MIFGGTLALAKLHKDQGDRYGVFHVKDCLDCQNDIRIFHQEWITDQALSQSFKEGFGSSPRPSAGAGEDRS